MRGTRPTRQKVFPHPTVGAPSASNSPSALSVRAPRAGWIRGEVTRNAGGGLHILEIVHHNRYILSNVWGKRWVPNHCQINLKPFLHPRHHPYIYILLYHLHHVVYMMIIVIVCVMYKMMIIMRILLLSLIRLPGYAGTRPPWDSQSLHIYPNIIIMKTYMFNVNIEKCTCHILIKSRRFSAAFSACWARVRLFSSIKGSLHQNGWIFGKGRHGQQQ